MRFAYLILAHHDLEQVRLLARRLLRDDPGDFILLHWDRNSPVTDEALRALAQEFGGSLALVPRIACLWGHPSLCRVELTLLQALEGRDFDYAHLLSGQDWPLMSKSEMVDSIAPGACYQTVLGPVQCDRMDQFHLYNRLVNPRMRETVFSYRLKEWLRWASRCATKAAAALGRPRRCPFGPSWQKGWAWWSLPREAVDHLRTQMQELVADGRLRFTLCSDEHVSPTIIHYSPFGSRIRDNRRYLVWPDGSSPLTLTRAHLGDMLASQAWFARKLDRKPDPFFLEL